MFAFAPEAARDMGGIDRIRRERRLLARRL